MHKGLSLRMHLFSTPLRRSVSILQKLDLLFSLFTISCHRRMLYKFGIVCTQRSWKRPYGVGLLVGRLDETGAHLYYNCPSGNYFEYQAFAIGARSQSAKSYLERKFESFVNSTRDDLIKDALFAIKETLQGEKLTSSICTVVVVGLEEDFHILDQKTIQEFIELLEIREEAPVQEEAGQDGGAAMQEDRSPEVPPPAPMNIGDM
ncbi:hypothetical protein MKW92_031135 [Papaver armeniacum]|nr:hypothetical protein MKW92_031135 [Papaver armeniacum]